MNPSIPMLALIPSLVDLSALLLAVSASGEPLAAQSTRRRPGLVETTIPELQTAMSTGKVTSRQIVLSYLERIVAYDKGGPQLNALLQVNPMALAEANARDMERANGLAHGPLFGVPVLLKDNIDTADMPTTAGSLALEGSIPPDDAFLTQKLRAAGAILLGKATLTEFSNALVGRLTGGMPQGYSSLGGYGFNPYDPRPLPGGDGRPVLTPGGSSSGSAVAVSANLVTVAVGTETSSSILWPGHANCVVGIKPTLGLVSRDGIVPFTSDMDTAGPLARTVTDAAILLGVLAGHDPADPATAACLVPGNCYDDYTVFLNRNALVGARIAVPHTAYWGDGSLTQVQRLLMLGAIAVLRLEGAVVVDPYEIPNQSALTAREVCGTYPPGTCSTALLYGLKRDLDAFLASLGPLASIQSLADVIAFNNAHAADALRYGQDFALAASQLDTSPGSSDTLRYQADRALDFALFKGALDELYAGPDAVPGTADDFDAILFPANNGAWAPAVSGYPSIVVPGGFTPPAGQVVNPRPFGVTFSGPAFSEPRLIGFAFDFEQATKHRRPPESTPVLLR